MPQSDLDCQFFLNNGRDHYTAARLSAQAQIVPLTGTLFRLSVEMLLKAKLRRTVTLETLKKKPFGHNLSALWSAFKRDFPNLNLSRHDTTIHSLGRFEEIRYPPKRSSRGGMAVQFEWGSAPVGSQNRGLKHPRPEEYRLYVERIDDLVRDIFDLYNWRPTLYFRGPAVRDAIRVRNRHAMFFTGKRRLRRIALTSQS
jgi:hypothetical protein